MLLAEEAQTKPVSLPHVGEMDLGGQESQSGWSLQNKVLERENIQKELQKTAEGTFFSLQLSSDQCMHAKKLHKGREKCNINSW